MLVPLRNHSLLVHFYWRTVNVHELQALITNRPTQVCARNHPYQWFVHKQLNVPFIESVWLCMLYYMYKNNIFKMPYMTLMRAIPLPISTTLKMFNNYFVKYFITKYLFSILKGIRAIPWLLTLHFWGFGPTLNAITYISLISLFTIVTLYPDLTQHKIRISETCYMYTI